MMATVVYNQGYTLRKIAVALYFSQTQQLQYKCTGIGLQLHKKCYSTSTKQNSEEPTTGKEEPFHSINFTSDTDEESVRNISGLDSNHHRQYHGQPPILPYKDLRMRRKLFAKYGLESGEDPRIMWPSRMELLQAEEEEKEQTMSLQQRLQSIQSQRDLDQKQRLERHKTIEKNMAQMPKIIADYQARLKKAEDEVKDRRMKREELLEEAREYFGYKISAHDPKFEEMIEERKENEKKEAKLRKREEKAKKQKAKLLEEARKMGMNIEELDENDKKKS